MLELLSQEVFVELTVKEILWGYENPLIELAKGIFPPEKQFPFDKFGLFVGVSNNFDYLLLVYNYNVFNYGPNYLLFLW